MKKEIIQSIIQDYRTTLKRTVSYLSETQGDPFFLLVLQISKG